MLSNGHAVSLAVSWAKRLAAITMYERALVGLLPGSQFCKRSISCSLVNSGAALDLLKILKARA